MRVCGVVVQGEGKEKDEAVKLDALKQDTRRRHKEAAALILNAAKLVAPVRGRKPHENGVERAQESNGAKRLRKWWMLESMFGEGSASPSLVQSDPPFNSGVYLNLRVTGRG